MHESINVEELIEAVRSKFRCTWIGAIGSVAGEGKRFASESDIDLVVLGDRSGFSYMTHEGRSVELHQYDNGKLDSIVNHPEWFGLDWPWEVGKFVSAEPLWGNKPNINPPPLSRAIALLGAVGRIVGLQKKFRDGRIQRVDSSHAVFALKNLVQETYPLSYFEEDPAASLAMIDQARGFLEPILKQQLGSVFFYPEHRDAISYLNDRWQLGLATPDMSR